MYSWKTSVLLTLVFVLVFTITGRAQDKRADISQKLQGFDAFMEKTMKEWNGVGIGLGIVVNDKLVFAKGYGYRDYEKKLPITANTLFPIASHKTFHIHGGRVFGGRRKIDVGRPHSRIRSLHSVL